MKRLQGWLSSFSVEFVASVNPLSRLMVVEKNTLTVLPCYLTAAALANIWDLEPGDRPMIMKLTVRRFCQDGVDGYHDHDCFFSWSSAGVHKVAPNEVESGTHVIQFFSVSVSGDVSLLEKIRTNLLPPCEDRQPEGEGAQSGASLGGTPCPHGSTCTDFVDWKRRLELVDFREVFFIVCATHPQYPGTHYSQLSQEWVDLCAEHSPELFTAFLDSLNKKTTLACHRGNLDLFMYEHITAAVHRY